ncbi:MAG: hydroxymethylbilane synthase [Bacteroidota bacterium]
MKRNRLTIATRGSTLALWQSTFIKSRLEHFHPGLPIELHVIKTLGDKILDSPLSKIGDKGLFTKEIEQALLEDKADLAVHSLKDLPTELIEGLEIAAVTEREDLHDVFVARRGSKIQSLNNLPANAKIATGSLRRRCQLLRYRDDLTIVDIRGNLTTRLNRLDESDWHGMILAKAGLTRLGWSDRISEVLPFDIMLPAVGQGALAVEARSNDSWVRDLVTPLHHERTFRSVSGERALLRTLEGGCQIPIGAHGRIESGIFFLEAFIGSLDGKRVVRGTLHGTPDQSEALGVNLATLLSSQGGKSILDEIRTSSDATFHPGGA